MHGLGLCIAVNSYVAHRLYAGHIWELPVLHYHRIRVNYPYSCLGVIFGVILHVFKRQNYHKNQSNCYPFFPHYGKLPYCFFKLPHFIFSDVFFNTVWMKYLTIISGQLHLLHQYKSDFAHILGV